MAPTRLTMLQLCGLWLVAPMLVTLVHELGHLGVAAFLGSRPLALSVGPFGGGLARYEEAALSTPEAIASVSGGLAVNLATGLAALALAKHAASGSRTGFAAAVFGAASVVSVPAYLFFGLSRELGDPAEAARLFDPEFFSSETSALRTGLGVGFGLGTLVATWCAAKIWLRHQLAVWPNVDGLNRPWLTARLLAPLLLVFALRLTIDDPSTLARQIFIERAEVEVHAVGGNEALERKAPRWAGSSLILAAAMLGVSAWAVLRGSSRKAN